MKRTISLLSTTLLICAASCSKKDIKTENKQEQMEMNANLIDTPYLGTSSVPKDTPWLGNAGKLDTPYLGTHNKIDSPWLGTSHLRDTPYLKK